MITWLTTRLGRWFAAAGALVLAILGAFVAGKREGKSDAKADKLREELDAIKRVEDAETGIGATDAERIEWLRDLGRKWNN